MPEALVGSWALAEGLVDVPVAVGADPRLRLDRYDGFERQLELVRVALERLRRAHTAAAQEVDRAIGEFDAATGGAFGRVEPAVGGSVSDLAGRAPLPSMRLLGLRVLVGAGRLARRVWTGVIRGPPGTGYAGWFIGRHGAGRQLRLTVGLFTPARDRAVARADGALARNRAARERAIAAAGGITAVLDAGREAAGFAALAAQNGRTGRVVARRDAAWHEFLTSAAPAMVEAAEAGLTNRVIELLSGLRWEQVGAITRRPSADPRERFRWVDALRERWIRVWGRWNSAEKEKLRLADGEWVTVAELRSRVRDIDAGRGGYQLAMLVGDRVAGMIGRDRMAVYDLSDGHFHHLGYDDPRNNGIARFLLRLRAAGHQGVITFHPIPQRGMGLATLGGTFYYGIASVLTLGLLFDQPMLQMWGKFPDVRLLDAVRALPAELRWRAVVGVVGARMDVPGARGYLRTLAMLNPDEAVLVGETTIAKEAVTDLLGDQAIHTINPAWANLVQRLVAAVGLLRTALREGELAADRLAGLPAELTDVIRVGAHADPVGVAAGLVDVLVGNIGVIAELLAAAGHPRSGAELATARRQIES
ncbi:hypothetical protein, partial [Pseudonocardia zijingensis]|uniref:hypothetical protein n=1 Tax=Pseudonocardia zijingensis TaxID=153376 RepID=UPI0031DFB5E3